MWPLHLLCFFCLNSFWWTACFVLAKTQRMFQAKKKEMTDNKQPHTSKVYVSLCCYSFEINCTFVSSSSLQIEPNVTQLKKNVNTTVLCSHYSSIKLQQNIFPRLLKCIIKIVPAMRCWTCSNKCLFQLNVIECIHESTRAVPEAKSWFPKPSSAF